MPTADVGSGSSKAAARGGDNHHSCPQFGQRRPHRVVTCRPSSARNEIVEVYGRISGSMTLPSGANLLAEMACKTEFVTNSLRSVRRGEGTPALGRSRSL